MMVIQSYRITTFLLVQWCIIGTDQERTSITWDIELWQWMKQNHERLHYPSVSKMVTGVMTEYMKSQTTTKEENDTPMTPQEEHDRIVEEMGKLNQKFDEKFTAIRSLIPKEEKGEDPPTLRKTLWNEVSKRNGSIRLKGKTIGISREDLDNFEHLGNLFMRKLQLEELLEGAKVASKSASPERPSTPSDDESENVN